MPTTANDLNISQAGIVSFDGTATFNGRTLQAGSGITITNGSGILGDPTISVTGGSTGVVEHLTGDTGGQLNPTANNFNIISTVNPAASTPIQVAGSGSSLSINLQRSQALAAPNLNKVGLSNFNSARFTVDTNGFVDLTKFQLIQNYTLVDDDASPYVVLANDNYISCDVADAVLTLKFPDAPTTGRIWTIKDLQGTASIFNISITTVGGAVLIDGVTTYKIVSNYGAINLLFNGSSYEVY